MTPGPRDGQPGSGPIPTGTPRRGARLPLPEGLRTPLYRNALALLVNSGVTSLIGVAYWTLAARLAPADIVGRNAALISAMVALASLSHLGLEGALGGFLPRAGAATGALVKRAYGMAAVLAVAFATIFVLAAPRVSVHLRDLYRPGMAVLFVGAVLIWSLFALQDCVLTGLRRAVWIPLENILYSAVKLGLVLALARGLAGYGILVSWIVPAALALFPVTLVIFKAFIPAHLKAYGTEPGRGTDLFSRFVVGDGFGMLLAQVYTALLPILVMEHAGAEAAGHFYIAWMLTQSLDLIAVNVGMSLTVEGAHVQDEIPVMFRRILVRTLALVALIVGLAILATPFVLALFGAGYASASAGPLRLLLLGSLFRTIITLAICAARAERRPSLVIALQAGLTVIIVPLAWRLTEGPSAVGTALAWTIGQLAVAVLAVFLVRHLFRGPQPPSAGARHVLVDHVSEAP
jgi:O-antigen/teichoic acid export membrane protein